MDDTPAVTKKNGTSKIFEQFKEQVGSKLKDGVGKVALFTHPSPDPDAIGSQMGLAWLFRKVYDVEVDMFISGAISHPQNLTMEKLLAPKLIPIEDCKPGDYDLKILVDTIPGNTGRKDIPFDVVIDHHVELPVINGYNYLFINLHTGSCCGTIYSLIEYFGATFEEDIDYDRQVATAMMVGIYTDTCGLLGDRRTKMDGDAFNELFDYRDPEALKEIAKFKRPKSWVTIKATAATEAITEDGVAVVGLGNLSAKNRDLISDQSTEMLLWEGVNLSIAFALISGDTLQGSIRSACASVSAAKVAHILGSERGGTGWGHAQAAGYTYSLTGFSIKSDEDEETKIETWKLLNKREVKRIFTLLKK